MKKFALLVALSVPAFAANHAFHEGRLTAVATDSRLDEGTTFERSLLTVEADGIRYTVRGDRVKRHAKDLSHGLVIGDPVQVSVEGSNLVLLKPDGKDWKTTILTRERIQQ